MVTFKRSASSSKQASPIPSLHWPAVSAANLFNWAGFSFVGAV